MIKKIFNLEKNWLIFLIILLVVSASLAIWSAKEDSETTDECVYIASSYNILKHGNFSFNPEHPPLSKYFFAIPLLFTQINEPDYNKLVYDSSDYYYYSFWEIFQYGNNFLYHVGNDAELIIFLARLTSVVFMLGLGILIFFWTKQLFGLKPAFFSLILYLFNPLVLSTGHIANPDMVSAFTFTLFLYIFWKFSKKQNTLFLLLSGIFLGVALLSRFSSLILVPYFVIWLIYYGVKDKKILFQLRNILIILALSFIIVWIGYGMPLKTAPHFTKNSYQVTVGEKDGSGKYNQIFHKFADVIIPADYFKGLIVTLHLQETGLGSFLDGKHSGGGGWWYYFPMTFFYKSPLYLIFFVFIYIIIAFTKPKHFFSKDNIYLLGMIILFSAIAMKSKMDLGVRYIFPVYILTFIALGQITQNFKNYLVNIFWVILIGGTVYTMIIISPKYITYFNEIAGGAENGYKHLLDSNIDWGQDVKRLNNFMKENKIDKIYMDYVWKKNPLSYYKINYEVFNPEIHHKGFLAISVSNLVNNNWISKNYELVSRLGNSLYIFKIK